MGILFPVILICILFIAMSIRYRHAELTARSASVQIIGTKNRIDKSQTVLFLSYIGRFFCAFILCFLILTLLVAYDRYWTYFGIAAIKTCWPSPKYFERGFYLLLVPISLVGAICFTYPTPLKSKLYQKIVWWLFPAAVSSVFLGSFGHEVGRQTDSGMWVFSVLVGYFPFFLICFGCTFLLVTTIFFIFEKHVNDMVSKTPGSGRSNNK